MRMGKRGMYKFRGGSTFALTSPFMLLIGFRGPICQFYAFLSDINYEESQR